MMDIHAILKKLPHRYPFLLVDRVISLEPGKTIRTIKNVTIGMASTTLSLSSGSAAPTTATTSTRRTHISLRKK